MIEEPTGREVSTPRVNSRAAAWAAFESTMLARYSKYRKKLEKRADKEQEAFEKEVYGEDSKIWMFVHSSRWRRKEIQIEPSNARGTLVWIPLDRRNNLCSEAMIHPRHEFHRIRQEHLFDIHKNMLESRGDNSDPACYYRDLFHEGFHRFEMTPEQLREEDERLEAEAAAWRKEMEARRIDSAERQRILRDDRCRLYVSSFYDISEVELREELARGGAMNRVFYMTKGYSHLDDITMDILAATITRIDDSLERTNAYDMISWLFGYASFEVAKNHIVNGLLPNRKFTIPTT